MRFVDTVTNPISDKHHKATNVITDKRHNLIKAKNIISDNVANDVCRLLCLLHIGFSDIK